jgi:phospholipid/cholesterol/gamma-HCH transport system permease protein
MAASSTEPNSSFISPPEPREEGDERVGLWAGLLGGIGEPALFAWEQVVGIVRVLRLTLYYVFAGKKRWNECWIQSFKIGNKSLIFVTAVSIALGMTLVYQSGLQAQRITGDLSLMGALYLQVLLREFAPTITALMVATRVGTGIAAEIGSMVVTEQVDALRMSGAHPIDYLIVPRFLASTLMVGVLTIYCVLIYFLAGMATAKIAFDVSPYTYANLSFIIPGDIIICLSKALVYGMVIPIVAGHSGLDAHGGSEGVGWATTQSVVNCSLAVVFIDFILSSLGYIFLLR